MALPLIAVVVLGILEIAAEALAVYEALEVLRDVYEGFEKYTQSVENAKAELKELIKRLEQEIEQKIEEKEEVAILLAASAADPQGPVTRKAQGRGTGVPLINAAVEQKIPFRQVISLVCEKAAAIPVLNLRRKKGVKLKDLPQAKRKALEALLEKGVETIADIDLDEFIVVRLKQLAANLMFEFVDYCLDWKSPLKCEVCFGPKPGYADHPIDGAPTKLKRSGLVNPFYPAPYRQSGSISADLIIPDYRKKRCDKGNIFAIVEVKFPGDRIEAQQFEGYHKLLDHAAQVKTKAALVRFDNKPVAYGGRVSLFRFPEDVADKSRLTPESKKSGKKPGKKHQ